MAFLHAQASPAGHGYRNNHASSATAMRLDPLIPKADGILFDDTLGFTPDQIQLLKARRMLFTTRFRDEEGDRWFRGVIIAAAIDAARAVAFGRGLDEVVLGELL
ncbi:hypothetical protein [Rhizobium lusitanum]|nr:hypothetical protein [Rhizobium lusitanum]